MNDHHPYRPSSYQLVLLALVALVPAACTSRVEREVHDQAREILEHPEAMTIYALHPNRHSDEGKPTSAADSFHDYRILDRAEVTAADERSLLTSLVYRGINASDGTVAACFDPRHGIRAVKDSHSVDLVICYECLQIYMYGTLAVERQALYTTSHVEPDVSRLFQRHGLDIHGK